MTAGAVRRDSATAEFFDGTAKDQFLLRRCADCGTFAEPYVRYCPGCESDRLEWAAAAGGATVVSWSVVHRRVREGQPAQASYFVHAAIGVERHIEDEAVAEAVARGLVHIGEFIDPDQRLFDVEAIHLPDRPADRIVADGVNALRDPARAFVVITHYQRLLEYVKPDVVHVMARGRIVKTGGPELALELERNGYRDYADAAA